LDEQEAERKNKTPTRVESIASVDSRASGDGENDSEEDSDDDFKFT